MYRNYFKRFFDFIAAFLGLLILSPFLILVAIVLFFRNKGKPFFVQTRPGLNQQLFKIVKFRTMTDEKDTLGNLLPDAKRMTKIGSFIRRNSIDELPQLLNVIKGDMSLIGPRPLLKEYLPLYTESQNKRHEVRPGITGWAQVNGRNAISWEEKLAYDFLYINNISLKFDMQIIVKTIKKVLKSEGISSATSVTIEKFKGN